jgi:hypothetical protein
VILTRIKGIMKNQYLLTKEALLIKHFTPTFVLFNKKPAIKTRTNRYQYLIIIANIDIPPLVKI